MLRRNAEKEDDEGRSTKISSPPISVGDSLLSLRHSHSSSTHQALLPSHRPPLMASLSTSMARHAALHSPAAAPSFQTKSSARINGWCATSFVSLRTLPTTPLTLRNSRALRISCQAGPPPPAAKPETLTKVVEIVTRQLAAPAGTVHPHSKFQELGADSLDQVEIVMALEEEFKISVDEDGAESIVTVQDAANLIEKVASKC